ncbi:MFS transporter [Gluconobacter cerinus]|uniref:MFS transporter n=1 Tax=Gluconobacter cerinus TaxID=38307 RepID=UPI003AB78924
MQTTSDRSGYHLFLVLVIYVYSAVSMAVVGLVVPFISAIAEARHVSPGPVGTSLSFFSVPAAFTSFLFGMVVDRIGVKRAFPISVVLTLIGDSLLLSTSTLWSLRIGLMLCGCGFAFATAGSPVLFMRYLPEKSRSKALAFWSTFAPAGYSAGLLLAIPFLNGGRWQAACTAHMALMVAILAVGVLTLAGLKEPPAVLTESGPAKRLSPWLVTALGLSVTLPNGIAYGTSLIAPSYLARVHHVSLAASAAEVAIIKIVVMLAGGLIVSLCVGTERRSRVMFCIMAAIGMLAQWLLLFPGSTMLVASAGLFLWTFAYSGLSGAGMSLLPVVATDRKTRGVVAGTVGQFISVSAVLMPYLYFSTTLWTSYALFAFCALGMGCLTIFQVRQRKALA